MRAWERMGEHRSAARIGPLTDESAKSKISPRRGASRVRTAMIELSSRSPERYPISWNLSVIEAYFMSGGVMKRVKVHAAGFRSLL